MKKDDYRLVDTKTGKLLDDLSLDEKDDLKQRLVQEWNWCTDDERIMLILHHWIGAERDSSRTLAEPFFLVSSPDMTRIVTFWESAEGDMALNKGEPTRPFDTPFNKKTASNMRGAMLNAFVKLEFIIDHLILLRYGVYSPKGRPSELLETIRSMGTANKIKILQKSRQYPDIDFNAFERLKRLRNQLAHQFSLQRVEYYGSRLEWDNDDAGQSMTDRLNDDFESALCSLLETYYNNQDDVIEWLLDRLAKSK